MFVDIFFGMVSPCPISRLVKTSPSTNDMESESAEQVEFQLNAIEVPSHFTVSDRPCSKWTGAAAMKGASQWRLVWYEVPHGSRFYIQFAIQFAIIYYIYMLVLLI